MAGYSSTPLPRKLGLQPGSRFGAYAAPKGLGAALGELPQGVTLTDAMRGKTPLDVILCFADSQRALDRLFPRAQRRLDPNGGLWICWPKKASGVVTDVTEGGVRRLGLEAGLVDNKVCAIDETWSGLRMVVRLTERPQPARAAARKTPGKKAVPGARRPKKI